MHRAILTIAALLAASVRSSGEEEAAASSTGAPPASTLVTDSEFMIYGQEQVDQVVADRPQLAAVVHDHNEIEQTLVKDFAAPDLKFRLVWKNVPTIAGPTNSAESSTFPDAMNRSYITVDGIWKSGPKVGIKRTPEEILVSLVFEIANASKGPEKADLAQRALRGEIDREAYILKATRLEYDAWQSVLDFHERIWLPYCHATAVADSPALWRLDVHDNFDEWLKRYPRSNWYPWEFYGKIYDQLQAYQYKDTLAKAEKDDAVAQAHTGVMLGAVGLYDDSTAWFLKAANQGNVQGELAMEWNYYNGVGVPKDDAQAFSWAMKAAEQGDATAEKTVAWHYRYGIGAPTDPAMAKLWEDKAAAAPK